MPPTDIPIPPAPAVVETEELDNEVELREVEILPEWLRERLDRALVSLLPAFSRNHLKHLIEDGFVCHVGSLVPVTKVAHLVKAAERYQIRLQPTDMSQAYQPQDMALDIVFEDEHLRVIHKPVGLVVHPAPGNWSGTLLNGLLALDPQAVMLPRAGIVHRLDKDTSGLMIVARTRLAMDALVAMIAEREVHREYLAVAYRKWSGTPVRDIVAAIGRDYRNRLRMAVVDLERLPGKEAHTTFECLSSQEEACLVQCTLHTGRTHQIRVHMAHFGHPLVGDSLYAGPMTLGIDRQALHAFRLSFDHPITGAPLKFEAPLPDDMVNLLAGLGLKRPE